MGYFTTATKGTGDGQFCTESCGHDDCRWMREIAAEPCTICRQPLGEGTNVYTSSEHPTRHGHAHASCLRKQYRY